ncbi:MAG: helix-turn-helix transcriptional regulator [Peptostreptococcaceae bacterium]
MKNYIRKYRLDKDVTQEEMCRHIGISRQSLINIEKQRCNPSLKIALKISIYFDEDLRKIFE